MASIPQLWYELLDFSQGATLAALKDEIQKHTLSPYCITDAQGHIQSLNHAYAAFYGFLKSELEGQHVSIVLPPAAHERFAQVYAHFVAHGEGIPQDAVWEVSTKEGYMRNIVVRSVRVQLANGQVSVVTLVEPVY